LIDTAEVEVQTDLATTAEIDVQTDLVDTIEASMQTRLDFAEEKETEMEEAPAYTPIVEKAANQKLHNELIQTQHELAQCRKEVVPTQEYYALLKKFTDLSAIEHETFYQLKEEKAKVNKAQD